MIWQILLFWLASSLPAAAAWPLVWRGLGSLPDRGFGMTRTAGILFSAYLYWIACTVGLIPNSIGGILGVVLILGILSAFILKKDGKEFFKWIRQKSRLLLIEEGLFLAAFIFWAFVRANNPDLVATEKPMELAFLNSILISPGFPPRDPWLSGYAISYYYFGYIMIAMLTRISGLSSGITFNLGNALWFAMTFTGSYSILYNLLLYKKENARRLLSLFAPAAVLISGNLEGVLEVLHRRMVLWKTLPDGTMTSSFWTWLGIKQLVDPPTGTSGWLPDRYLWWWRASRVVNDINLAGGEVEVIDEFPFFSFILADNHPHVLALPFALLAVAFALHIFYRGRKTLQNEKNISLFGSKQERFAGIGFLILTIISLLVTMASGQTGNAALIHFIRIWLAGAILAAVVIFMVLFLRAEIPRALSTGETLFACVIFGGLAFLNTWDLPIYLTLVMGILFYIERKSKISQRIKSAVFTGTAILIGAVLLYSPWIAGFQSQLGGILPNLIYPTRFIHFLVMFGIFIIPVILWTAREYTITWRRGDWKLVLAIGIGLPLLLWGISLGLSGIIRLALQENPQQVQELLTGMGAANLEALIQAVIDRRTAAGWTSLFLGFLFGVMILLYARAVQKQTESTEEKRVRSFILILIGIGALLVLGVEFLYLRDLFLTRMNTVFKFYYATWVLWGIAASWIIASAFQKSGRFNLLLRIAGVFLLCCGLVYSTLAVWTKTTGFEPPAGRTLDGTAYLAQSSSDYEAIGWMKENLSPGTVVEAVGGSYTQYGRISAHTGFPTVLGWPFHEYQWRGTLDYHGSRETDIQNLYQTRTWEEAKLIIRQYDIRYVYVGQLERQKYQSLNESKFVLNLKLIYNDDAVSIYEVPVMEVP